MYKFPTNSINHLNAKARQNSHLLGVQTFVYYHFNIFRIVRVMPNTAVEVSPAPFYTNRLGCVYVCPPHFVSCEQMIAGISRDLNESNGANEHTFFQMCSRSCFE